MNKSQRQKCKSFVFGEGKALRSSCMVGVVSYFTDHMAPPSRNQAGPKSKHHKNRTRPVPSHGHLIQRITCLPRPILIMSSPNSDKRPADELGGVDDVVSTTSKKPRSTLQPKLQRPSNDNVPVNVYMAGGTVFGINNGHYLLPAIQGQKIKDICWMMSSTATRDEFTGKEAYILFSNGKLVQWGKGQEQWHDVCHQHRKISKSPFLTSVAQVACGYHHAAAVKTDGSVWTWGYENQYGQLGREPAKATGTLFPPSKVDALGTSPIHQVACAVGATFALNECGQVFSWGSHHTGETGQGKDFGFDPEPKLIHLPPAKQISACCAHAGALTTDGKVYAWGMLLLNCSEDDGRTTGNDDYDDEEEEFEYITSPTLVEGGLQGKIVKQLDSGTSEMGALTVDGSCYMWGDGPVENGGYPGYKSGFQPASMTKWFPKDLSNCKIASIAIGGYHAVFLTTNGEVLVG